MKKYDGCSGGVSWFYKLIMRKDPPMECCCDAHDQVYAIGGSARDRWVADYQLFLCVFSKTESIFLASLFFYAVRIGGHPLLPLPWRWGFTKEYLTYYV